MNPQTFPMADIAETNALATGWVETYGDFLFNFAVGQVRDSHVAEDLVQETFLGALKSQSNLGVMLHLARRQLRTELASIFSRRFLLC